MGCDGAIFRLMSGVWVVVLMGACSAAGVAQAPSAAPAATIPAAAPPVQAGAATIRSRVSLVSLDIVVTDASGHAVHGLKPADFTVLEDGQKMTPRSFEEHRVDMSAAVPDGPKAALPANVFTNFADTRSNGALNVLLLDLLNTPVGDQVTVRQQMMEYLKNIPAGMRMAVFGLNAQLEMLQGFTSDPAMLKSAIEGMGSKRSILLRTAQDDDDDNDALAMLNGGGDPSQAEITQALANFQAEGAAMQTVVRIQDTLDALKELARYLDGLPGRKNLIWFSGSFPVSLNGEFTRGSATGITKPFGPSVQQDFTADTRVAADLLARAHVAAYPIDARGVFTNPAMKVDTSQSSLTNPFSNGMPSRNGDPTAVPNAFAQSEVKMEKQMDEEHGAMDEMADETGGKAQYGTNGLKDAVATAIENGSNYYTVTYAPTNHDWNGEPRTIKVSTDKPGVQLLYRHGYFAAPVTAAANGASGARSAMQQAMIHGAPNATQIVFRVRVDEAAATESLLPKGNQPNEKLMKPPYRHYTVWYAADLRNVVFSMTPDGIYHGEVQYEAKLCDSDGQVINGIADAVHANLPTDKYLAILKQGLYVKQELDAPAKGQYYLRIGMHDPTSDHVGAVEIPLSAVKVAAAAKLAPVGTN
jgi:VWFA-related protein